MFKKWIKQFLAMSLCLMTLLSPITEAYAKDYKKDDTDDDFSYYIVEGQEVKKLFELTLGDVPNILDWILNFKSYTVIKKYQDSDNETVYKCYFNTPNLQSIVKNSIISKISDGYTDDTYNINETEWIVPVGKNADSENAITKYGFNIPNYTYMGEYPKEVMSPAGIVPSPKKWYEVLWRAIKALFGASFLKAPAADNYNSIKYLNHTYTDRSDYILDYFKKYYLKYLENQIITNEAVKYNDKGEPDGTGDYFKSPEEVMDLTVTEDAYDAAELYNLKYEDEYDAALMHYAWWYKYKQNGYSLVGVMDNTDWLTDPDFIAYMCINDNPDLRYEDEDEEFEDIFNAKWTKLAQKDQTQVVKTTASGTDVELPKQIYNISGDYIVDGWHFITSRDLFKKKFRNWLKSNSGGNTNYKNAAIFLDSIPESVQRYKYTGYRKSSSYISEQDITQFKKSSDYKLSDTGLDEDSNEFYVSDIAADIIRYTYDYIQCRFLYDTQSNTTTYHKDRTASSYRYVTKFTDVDVYKKITDEDGNESWHRIEHENEIFLGDIAISGSDTSYNFGSYSTNPGDNNGSWNTYNSDTTGWVTADGKANQIADRLYKDCESWVSNPSTHIENEYEEDYITGDEYVYSGPNTRVENVYTCDVTDVSFSSKLYVAYGLDWSNPGQVSESWRYDDDNIEYRVNGDIIVNKEITDTIYHRDDSQTKIRDANFRYQFTFDGKDDTRQITDNNASTYRNFLNDFDFNRNNIQFTNNKGEQVYFKENDIVHPDLQSIYYNVEHNNQLMSKYKRFNRMMSRGWYYKDADKKENMKSIQQLPYRQCMIENKGEDGECKSNKYGDEETTLTLANIIVYSGIYKITEKHRANDYSGEYAELTDSEAHTILTQLQIYCGPYYTEVLSNMMKLMAACAKYEGDSSPTVKIIEDDPRVMPYDTGTMIKDDRKNYSVSDPRVELYKSHIIGSLVSTIGSDFSFSNINFGLGIFLKVQPTIIKIAGKITEVSVFLQSICDFDILDDLGLSPATFWGNSVFVNLLLVFVAIFFIIKTVIAVIKLGTQGSTKIFIGFLMLLLELGVLFTISLNPEGTWNKLKGWNKTIMNLGEMSVVYNYDELQYLFGDSKDYEVAYYLPYLDCWSKYNTGYGLIEDQQRIKSSDIEIDKTFYNPKIGGKDIEHYSILLADAFSYYGRSNSVVNTITGEDGVTINGNNINNNAYRAVDHFMAPRVKLTDSGTISMSVTENENYNGEFQKGIGDILVKLANVCFCCFMSIIKLMVFIFFWWQLYLFIFNVLLGLSAENKKMSTILAETFTPLLALVLLGMLTGICMIMNMTVEGFFGFCLIIFEFWLVIMIIRWWHDARRGMMFPFTLGWLYMLTNLSRGNRRREQERLEDEAEANARLAGIYMSEEQRNQFDKRTEMLFDESGNIRTEFASDPERYREAFNDWYKFAQNRKNRGYNYTAAELAAIRTYENHEQFKDDAQQIKNRYDKSNWAKTDEQQKNNKKPEKIKATPNKNNSMKEGAKDESKSKK